MEEKTPLQDLMNNALNHYNEAGNAISHHRSDIPIAIRFYYTFLIKNPTKRRNKDMKVKRERAKLLKEMGYSIRETMKIMGYKSPKSIQDLLNQTP